MTEYGCLEVPLVSEVFSRPLVVQQTLRSVRSRTQQFAKLRSESCFFPQAIETVATQIRGWAVLGNALGGVREMAI
jgi:hypothetical protein